MTDRTLLRASEIPSGPDPAALAAVSFLAGYPNPGTREAYQRDLRIFFTWCTEMGLHPLRDVQRVHLQAFCSHLQVVRGNSAATTIRRMGTLSGYYDIAVIDGVIPTSPAHHLKLPKAQEDPSRRTWLNQWELGAVMKAAKESRLPADWALVTLMGTLGMRVTAACNVRIEDMTTDAVGYRHLRTKGKGGKISVKVLPIPTWQAIDRAAGDRTSGWLLLRRDGTQMERRSADIVVKRLCRKAGVQKKITPHSLRRSFATLALRAGVPLHVVQDGMDHASSRTTQHYDRLGVEAHSAASNTVAALLASAS